jgi:hypothetical protein
MITVAVTSPKVLDRSEILGHPPMDTSPRPSATGNLHSDEESTTGATVGVGDGVGVAEGVGVAKGIEVATFTPLFHTSFLPDLIHLYLIPETVVAELSLVQGAPAFAAPDADIAGATIMIEARRTADTDRFIG